MCLGADPCSGPESESRVTGSSDSTQKTGGPGPSSKIPCCLYAEVVASEEFPTFTGAVVLLSPEGFRIDSEADFSLGQHFELRICPPRSGPEDDWLSAKARVQWTLSQAGAMGRATGCRWVELDRDQTARLSKLLESITERHPQQG